tara:strand:- start:449 stop:940 length:492 start_codon:yes stop_codon:yes gene_type:complete
MTKFQELPKLYCDMDQVLCDFITSANFVLGNDFTKVNNVMRWESIGSVKNFWEDLPWMPDGEKLYANIMKYDPYILSAYSERDKNCIEGKHKWIQKNTSIPVSRVNLVKRAEKKSFAIFNGQANVLIDDYLKNTKDWEESGGIAIHHSDTKKTLKELSNLGFI